MSGGLFFENRNDMGEIPQILHNICVNTTRFATERFIELHEMRYHALMAAAEATAESAAEALHIEEQRILWKYKTPLVSVHTGQKRRRRGRPAKPKLRLIICG